MAIKLFREQIENLVIREFHHLRRYQVLVIQANCFDTLAEANAALSSAFMRHKAEPIIFGWDNFFDRVGAISCTAAISIINKAAVAAPVIITGPLHFIDYWSLTVQESFWSYFSEYSMGSGIVFLDIQRPECVEPSFISRGIISGTEIRFLRSCLVAREEVLP